MDQIRETPHRSPLVVAEALKDVLTGKIVCDLGCAEGDNMTARSIRKACSWTGKGSKTLSNGV